MIAISFTQNNIFDTIEKSDPTPIFVPKSQFGLSEKEIEDIILEYVFDTTNVRIKSINELMKLRSLNNQPFFLLLNEYESNLKYCLAFGKIPGSIIFRHNDKFFSLGNIEEVLGDLAFSNSNIIDLGKLKRVEGSFWISAYNAPCKLKSLSDLVYVGKDLGLKHTDVTDLGNLEYVGGNLNLRNTNIFGFGKLKFIGGNLLLPMKLKGIINTEGIQIKGKILYFRDIEIPKTEET